MITTTGTYVSLIKHGKANPRLDVILKLVKALDEEGSRMLRPDSA